MSLENNDLIASFEEEANEVLADLENDLISIEESGDDLDKELVNRVFRGIHSMKGSAGFLGLKSLSELAHETENILNLIRNDELKPTSVIINAMLKAADALRTMVADVNNSNNFDVAQYISDLQAAIRSDLSDETCDSLDRDIDIALPSGTLAFVMISEADLVLRQRQGLNIYVAEVDLIADIQEKGATPLDLLHMVYKNGELINSYISTAGVGNLSRELPESFMFMILMASNLGQEELADALQIPLDRLHLIATFSQTQWDTTGPVEPDTDIVQPAKSTQKNTKTSESLSSQPSHTPEKAATRVPLKSAAKAKTNNNDEEKSANRAQQSAPSSGAKLTSLRVNVKVLDTLMNLAGELVLGRNQLLQEAETKDFSGINAVAARIDQVTSELQEAVMQTRMQPIGTVFNKFPRIVRDLCADLGKNCELEIDGSEVEMDKTIIEGIGDPLTHLIRNSCDHGIEMPEERTAREKPALGTIKLRAFHQAGKVNITIQDDGAGINIPRVKEKAVEKGMITTEQARDMSDREAARLIFQPGFSTATQVTSVSGRGVGMDVVRTNIEQLGGTVDIDSTIGLGTTIAIKLPLTLAIIPSLIVRSGSEQYAIPQVNISEIVRIKATDVAEKIEKIKNAEVLRLRGQLLPLVRLSRVLEKPGKYKDPYSGSLITDNRENIADRRSKISTSDRIDSETAERRTPSDRRLDSMAGAIKIIVVETGILKYGLIVDELFDNKEIVVKPLGHHMKKCNTLAGATILGDGKVALILDVVGIATHMELAATERSELKTDSSSVTDKTSETQSVMIFSNHPDEFFAIPTSFIARIERIQTDQIDTVGGQEVLQYRGTSLPLLCLEKHINAQSRETIRSTYVVVFKIGNKEAGLVAPELVDIHEIPAQIDTITFREKGIIGSCIVNNRTVRVVDIYEIIESSHRHWLDSTTDIKKVRKSQTTLLLAEDSDFFRQQMKAFIEAEGYTVVDCEDGQIAWDTLQKDDPQFDLILTDIEMPNMNGLKFSELVKADSRYSHLPIIAVTSLASEEDMEKGYRAGIDDYQIKLDRDKLLQSIKRLLGAQQPTV